MMKSSLFRVCVLSVPHRGMVVMFVSYVCMYRFHGAEGLYLFVYEYLYLNVYPIRVCMRCMYTCTCKCVWRSCCGGVVLYVFLCIHVFVRVYV